MCKVEACQALALLSKTARRSVGNDDHIVTVVCPRKLLIKNSGFDIPWVVASWSVDLLRYLASMPNAPTRPRLSTTYKRRLSSQILYLRLAIPLNI